MHSGEDKSNEVQLPEGVTPFVPSTQNELSGRKDMAEEVPLDDSGDEEFFPVVYGTGAGNEHTKKSNAAAGSTDQKKKSQRIPQGKGEDVKYYEGLRNEATSKLNSVYEEILPVVELYGPDNQDRVPTVIAKKWINAQCSKYEADLDLYFSKIKNAMFSPPATDATAAGPSAGGTGSQTANAEEGTVPQTANAEEGTAPQTANAEEGAGPQTSNAEGGAE